LWVKHTNTGSYAGSSDSRPPSTRRLRSAKIASDWPETTFRTDGTCGIRPGL